MIRTARDRMLNVLAVAESLRERHEELQLAITPARLWTILQREEIDILRARIRRPARAVSFQGHSVITLRRELTPRRAWRYALHEYAHIVLGHFGESDELSKNLVVCERGDVREHEANLLALLLVLGPSATPETPRVAAVMAKMVGQEYRRRAPHQIPLELPEPMPRVLTVADLEYEEEIERRIGKNVKRARLPDAKRVRIASAKQPYAARFIDRTGRIWTIYDRGDRRGFYHSHLMRKVYAFRRGEIRTITAARLDRQLREATALRPHHVNGEKDARTERVT
jgi:hypothetical protein